MNIILTGFMGTGKTAVGRRLARRLGWRFVDVDRFIEERTGMPIARLFAQRGEPVFRRLERRCISRLIRGTHQIIATGGGAFLDPANRSRLKASGAVICLTARPRAILERVGRRLASRPLLAGAGDPLARIRTLLAQRAGAYRQADLAIDTTSRSVDEIVDDIYAHVSPTLCRSWQYVLDHVDRLAQRYGGKYVVVANNRLAGSGETQLKAFRSARLLKSEEAGIYYIPLPEESLTAL